MIPPTANRPEPLGTPDFSVIFKQVEEASTSLDFSETSLAIEEQAETIRMLEQAVIVDSQHFVVTFFSH